MLGILLFIVLLYPAASVWLYRRVLRSERLHVLWCPVAAIDALRVTLLNLLYILLLVEAAIFLGISSLSDLIGEGLVYSQVLLEVFLLPVYPLYILVQQLMTSMLDPFFLVVLIPLLLLQPLRIHLIRSVWRTSPSPKVRLMLLLSLWITYLPEFFFIHMTPYILSEST